MQLWKMEADQDYAATTTYFKAKYDGLKEVQRLTGDTPVAHKFGSINAAMEENFDNLLEKINSSVEQRVNAAVQKGISQVYKKFEEANAAATADLKTQVYDLNSTVYQLCGQIQKLSPNINAGGNENQDPNTSDQLSTHNRHGNARDEHGFGADKVVWKTGLLYSSDWAKKQKEKLQGRVQTHGARGLQKVETGTLGHAPGQIIVQARIRWTGATGHM